MHSAVDRTDTEAVHQRIADAHHQTTAINYFAMRSCAGSGEHSSVDASAVGTAMLPLELHSASRVFAHMLISDAMCQITPILRFIWHPSFHLPVSLNNASYRGGAASRQHGESLCDTQPITQSDLERYSWRIQKSITHLSSG